jgi:hypothetical protein
MQWHEYFVEIIALLSKNATQTQDAQILYNGYSTSQQLV